MGRALIMNNVVWVLVLVLVAIVEADTPPGIANNPSHARCLIKKYKMCYNLEHVCPKFCPDSCTVECVSCKPICYGGSTSPPEEANPPPNTSPPDHASDGDGKSPQPSEGDHGGKGAPPPQNDEKSPPPKRDGGKGAQPPENDHNDGKSPPPTKGDEGKGPPPPENENDHNDGKSPPPTKGDWGNGAPPPKKGDGGKSPPPTKDEGKGAPPPENENDHNDGKSPPPTKGDGGNGDPPPTKGDGGKSPPPTKGDEGKGAPPPENENDHNDGKSPPPTKGDGGNGAPPPTKGDGGKSPPPRKGDEGKGAPPPENENDHNNGKSPPPTKGDGGNGAPPPSSFPPSLPPHPTPSLPPPAEIPPPSPPSVPSPGDSSEAAAGRRKRCKNRNYPQCYHVQHLCPSSCPDTCEVDCVTCKPVCKCDMPGAVCQDPRFNGGDGITFYFHGKKDKDFCLVTEPNFQINAHFIGKRNHNMNRDFTWVQSIAVLFGDHSLFVGAQKTATWNDNTDRLSLYFDGEPIPLPAAEQSTWRSSGTTITRDTDTNSVIVEIEGLLKISAKVVPITQHESRVHNYGITGEDCFAHLELGFKFFSLSGNVNGVLGQTYGDNYVSRVKMGVAMPVLGGDKEFAVSDIFATDCSVSQFSAVRGNNDVSAFEIPSMKCGSGIGGRGVVCKK